jgi:hypothetical protein
VTVSALEPYQQVLDRDWNLVGMWFAGVVIFLLLFAGVTAISYWWWKR